MENLFSYIDSRYDNLSDRGKGLVNLALRSIATAAILSIFSIPATYWYAVVYGARPPVEGVAFLSLSVFILGFLAFIISIIASFVLPEVVKQLAYFTFRTSISASIGRLPQDIREKIDVKSLNQNKFREYFEGLPSRSRSVVSIGSNIAIFIFGIANLIYAIDLSGMISFDFLGATALPAIYILGAMGLLGTCIFSIFDRAKIRLLQNTFFGVWVSVFVSMFFTPNFDDFLKITRFGGGIVVDLRLIENEYLSDKSLFLYSNNSITLFDEAAYEFRELNRDFVVEIIYKRDGASVLPQRKSFREIVY